MIGALLAALASAQAGEHAVKPVQADREHLASLIERREEPGAYCATDGRWCVRLTGGEKGPRPAVSGGGRKPERQSPTAGTDDYAVWPSLYLLKNGRFLAGVQHRFATGYSGGGGSVTTLQLYEISAAGRIGIRPVMERPLAASLTIRACFSQADETKRRGACHDEYGFSARLGLAAGSSAAMPILTYTTQAWSFPRGASRSKDSTQRSALRRDDLVRQPDPVCSFSRQLRFDPEAGIFRPVTPVPECSDYTNP